MSVEGPAKRTLLVTIDSLRYDHYKYMEQTREFLGDSHPRTFATSNATMYSFQSIIGGRYPSQPGLDSGTSFVPRVQSDSRRTSGYQSNALLSRQYGYADGFNTYDDIDRSNGIKGRLEKFLTEGSYPYRIAAFAYNQMQRVQATVGKEISRNYPSAHSLITSAINDIEERGDPSETDWFVWIHLMEPHHPYSPSSEFTDISRLDAQILTRKVLSGTATPEEESRVRELYRKEAIEADSELAHLWDWVPDDTRIVLCADHGELLGDSKRGWGHFTMFSPEILHVPLVTRNAPSLTGGVASLIDVPSLILGREYGEGSFSRDCAFAANNGQTAATDGHSIVTDTTTYPLDGSTTSNEISRLERERSRFSARLKNLDLDGAVDMEDLRDLGYA